MPGLALGGNGPAARGAGDSRQPSAPAASDAAGEAGFLELLDKASRYDDADLGTAVAKGFFRALTQLNREEGPNALFVKYRERIHQIGWRSPERRFLMLLNAGTTSAQRQQLRDYGIPNFWLVKYGDELDITRFIQEAREAIKVAQEDEDKSRVEPFLDDLVKLDAIGRGGPLAELLVECLNSPATFPYYKGRVSLAALALEAIMFRVFDERQGAIREYCLNLRLQQPDDPEQCAAHLRYLNDLSIYLSHRLGRNVRIRAPYLWADARLPPKAFGIKWPALIKDGAYTLIRLQYGGAGWDDGMDEKTRSSMNFLERFNTLSGFAIAKDEDPHRLVDLKNYTEGYAPPLLFMTGSGPIELSRLEESYLRKYLESGGMLFADAGSAEGDRAFRHFILWLLGRDPEPVPLDDPIFQQPFAFPAGAPPMARYGGGAALGVRKNGRWVVFYHPGGLHEGWKTGRVDENAMKLGVNILYYAYTKYYELTRDARRKAPNAWFVP